jgi:hypothetical protein
MAGRAKKQIRDTKTGLTHESMYAAGKSIGPAEYATLPQDQHIWFAIARDKANVGRFLVSEDSGVTFTPFVFTPSKRKPAAERKAAAEAKAAKVNGQSGTAVPAAPAGETREQKIARLRAELAESETAPAAPAAVVEEEESKPTPGNAAGKLVGTMKVTKT